MPHGWDSDFFEDTADMGTHSLPVAKKFARGSKLVHRSCLLLQEGVGKLELAGRSKMPGRHTDTWDFFHFYLMWDVRDRGKGLYYNFLSLELRHRIIVYPIINTEPRFDTESTFSYTNLYTVQVRPAISFY